MLEPVSETHRRTGARNSAPVTIQLTGISKYYAGIRALEDVDIEFYQGEVHAVLGKTVPANRR